LKNLFIAEKPSVGRQFADAMGYRFTDNRNYLESEEAIITWCVGHLVTMSYPEVYDEKYKRWAFETLPFIPEEWKYEVIESARNQYNVVSKLMQREDIDTIYVATDSGREGEYIYRLVEQQAGIKGKKRKRVWIDSQTNEEILRGIREAKDLSEYDNLSAAAYLRAQVDYLMGINFSRALAIIYSYSIKNYLKVDKAPVNVGRVMTCVLGIVVTREREIRGFVKTAFFRVLAKLSIAGHNFEGEWRAVEGSCAFGKDILYKENGFKEKVSAEKLIAYLSVENGQPVVFPTRALVESKENKKESKNPPFLFNMAELQNECSKIFKISPDKTLEIAQELYEKKLTTYPRTDARVLSTAVAKEIYKNIKGLTAYAPTAQYASEILSKEAYKTIGKSRYTNDKMITDHYAIIPTGQTAAVKGLSPLSAGVYELIVRRFLSIFYGPAVYNKVSLVVGVKTEKFFASFKVLKEEGYLPITRGSYQKKRGQSEKNDKNEDSEEDNASFDEEFFEQVSKLKKGSEIDLNGYEIKEGETSPPKRYNSGALIITMENAGQFIEDEELRAQIKGSGIGTPATRDGILKKLVDIKYLNLNNKTQIVSPTQLGEMVYEVVNASMRPLLNPALTASWERGLAGVAEGNITKEEYTRKINEFIVQRTMSVKGASAYSLRGKYDQVAKAYKK